MPFLFGVAAQFDYNVGKRVLELSVHCAGLFARHRRPDVARRNSLLLSLLASLTLLLAACMADVDQTITFLADEGWEVDLVIAFPAEAAPLAAGPVDSELDALKQTIENQGGALAWERRDEENGGLTYTVDAGGRGYDALRDVVGDVQVVPETRDGERVIVFSYFPGSDLELASSYTMTLIGDEIISSNGTETGRGQVQWQNPTGAMEAVLTERSALGPNWLPPALIGLLVLALAGAAAFFLLRRRSAARVAEPAWSALPPDAPPTYPTPEPPRPPAPAGLFCAQCGASLRPGARFCPTCGNPVAPRSN